MFFHSVKQSAWQRWPPILIGLAFFLAGSLMLFFVVLLPAWNCSRSSDWVETPCLILSNQEEYAGYSNRGGDTIRPKISYRYEFSGATHLSSGVDFCAYDGGDVRGILNRYPAGATNCCWVNPHKPSEAVLIRDWGRGLSKAIAIPFFSVFILIGMGALFHGALPTIQARWLDRLGRGPRRLQSGPWRLGQLNGLFIFNVIFNGFNAVLLILAWKWRHESEVRFILLFLTAFSFFGLLLLGSLLNAIRHCFRPALKVEIHPGSDWLCGERIDFRWQAPGENCFQIDLVSDEGVEIPVLEDTSDLAQGQFDFVVPDTMSGNKRHPVLWGLRIRWKNPPKESRLSRIFGIKFKEPHVESHDDLFLIAIR